MAMVACPGCGLPRVEAEVGARPCPVCHAAPLAGTGGSHPPLAKPPLAGKAAEPDPTEGLPTDVSELYGSNAPKAKRAVKPPRETGGSRVLPVAAVMFIFGTVCGVAGVLGWQSIDWSWFKKDATEVAARPGDEPNQPGANPLPPVPQPPAIAPMPHEPGVVLTPPEMQPDSEPEPKQAPPPPGRVTIVEINEPEATYSVPFPMKKGEHVVLKGKVKLLKVYVLDGGAILDASGLEAGSVTVSSKIDNRSTLKLNSPNGSVTFSGKVDGKSVVEINAPGGAVRFSTTTTANREGSKIDNGSTVSVTARTVVLNGDITGTDTKVSVLFTRNGWFEVKSVSGKATVEYKSQVAGWSPPDVKVGSVAPTATFRQIE